MSFKRTAEVLALVATLASASLLAAPFEPAAQERETFNALAQSLAAGVSGQTNVIIQISRWTTDEQADHLMSVLAEQNTEKLADELRRQPETGRIRIPGQVGTAWPLRYADQYTEDGKRYITLAADRPIDFWEAVQRQRRTWNYQITLIELVVDDRGEGEGTMQVGVELRVDPETGTITVKDMTTQPIRLSRVRK